MIKSITIGFFSFVIGFLAVVGIYFFLTKQYLRVISPLPTTQFSLANAPSKSVTGTITSILGDVLYQSRTAIQPVSITQNTNIQQGEKLETGYNGSATILFPEEVTMSIEGNAGINIVQTLRANVVIQQKQGVVSYDTTNFSVPVSVRGLDLLVTLEQGKSSISVDKDKSLVTVLAKNELVHVAFTNLQNISSVLDVPIGKRLTFNNDTKIAIVTP